MILKGFNSVDNRKNPRKNLEVQVILNPLNTSYFIRGQVRNISLGGIRVKNKVPPSPFEKEEEVRFSAVTRGDLILKGEGEVVWTSDIQGEVGIKFIQLAEETRRSLEKFLRFLG